MKISFHAFQEGVITIENQTLEKWFYCQSPTANNTPSTRSAAGVTKVLVGKWKITAKDWTGIKEFFPDGRVIQDGDLSLKAKQTLETTQNAVVIHFSSMPNDVERWLFPIKSDGVSVAYHGAWGDKNATAVKIP